MFLMAPVVHKKVTIVTFLDLDLDLDVTCHS